MPPLRVAIALTIGIIVWGLYVARVALGIGPMRDTNGNPEPPLTYLILALIVTAMLVAWLMLGAYLGRHQNRG